MNRDRRGANAEKDSRRLLADLQSNGEPVEPLALSDPVPLPHELESLPESEVARLFGQEFVSGLAQIEPGNWDGPVSSGYGLHLVRVQECIPSAKVGHIGPRVKRELEGLRG